MVLDRPLKLLFLTQAAAAHSSRRRRSLAPAACSNRLRAQTACLFEPLPLGQVAAARSSYRRSSSSCHCSLKPRLPLAQAAAAASLSPLLSLNYHSRSSLFMKLYGNDSVHMNVRFEGSSSSVSYIILPYHIYTLNIIYSVLSFEPQDSTFLTGLLL